MHTQETDFGREEGLGTATKSVAEHASALVRLELELATLELRRKVTKLAMGIAFGAVTAVLLLYALGFGIGAAAAGIATATSTWVALLIVTGGLVLLAAILGLIAMAALKKATPPVPEQALREAKLTTEALKSDGHA